VSADAVALALPGVDLLLDAGDAPGGAPSTIVAFDNDGPVLVRAGVVAWDRVIKSLQ
jgi:tRNA A37 threonylcarbamoyladenosine synthetase subunit TsaC/SUA5/YrdC